MVYFKENYIFLAISSPGMVNLYGSKIFSSSIELEMSLKL